MPEIFYWIVAFLAPFMLAVAILAANEKHYLCGYRRICLDMVIYAIGFDLVVVLFFIIRTFWRAWL